MKICVELHVESKRWDKYLKIVSDKSLSAAIKKIAGLLKLSKMCAELILEVTLINDSKMKGYNMKFRQIPCYTNVLSFPFESLKGKSFYREHLYLGDLVFACETIERESKEENKAFHSHFYHLFVHGFLHLLGYSHKNKRDRKAMQKQEIDILKGFKIKNPYIS